MNKDKMGLGRVPDMDPKPGEVLGALFIQRIHDSSSEVLDLLNRIEWRGDNVNHHGYRGFCPSCGNSKAAGHRTDCALHKVLGGPGPRLAGHLLDKALCLEAQLKEAKHLLAEEVQTNRELSFELKTANECLDANRREVSKLSGEMSTVYKEKRELRDSLSRAELQAELQAEDFELVISWAKELHELARHGLVLLAARLGIYSSPVHPDPASLYHELYAHMAKPEAARVSLHPLTREKKKAKNS